MPHLAVFRSCWLRPCSGHSILRVWAVRVLSADGRSGGSWAPGCLCLMKGKGHGFFLLRVRWKWGWHASESELGSRGLVYILCGSVSVLGVG